MRRAAGPAAALLALALGLALPADADLYRCPGPEGAVLYTSDPGRCPGAEPHEPSGELQSVPGAPPPESAAERPPAAPVPEAVRRATWRRKRERAEAELAALEERLPELRRATGACARGFELRTRDALGLPRELPCDEVRRRHREARERRAELRHYLEDGLAEACRRAGCRPGWVRPLSDEGG